MFVVISGTNRTGSNSLKIAKVAADRLRSLDREVTLLDLAELPAEVFGALDYKAPKPTSFDPWQQAIHDAEGVVFVVPEYNGGAPGILKYFIDLLKFPESLYEKPVAFIGLSAGASGGVRPTEHMIQVAQYRMANVYGRRVFLPEVHKLMDSQGNLIEETLQNRVFDLLEGFTEFTDALKGLRTRKGS